MGEGEKKGSEMTSYHEPRGSNQNDDSESLTDSSVYQEMLLNQRVRSIILANIAQHRKESKESSVDKHNKQSRRLQHRPNFSRRNNFNDESKEEIGEHNRKTVSTSDQFLSKGEESKEADHTGNSIDISFFIKNELDTFQLNHEIKQEIPSIDYRERDLRRNEMGSLIEEGDSMFDRDDNGFRSQDPVLLENQSIISSYRNRLRQYESRKHRRQIQTRILDSSDESSTEGESGRVKDTLARSFDRHANEELNRQSDDRIQKTRAKLREMGNVHEQLKENLSKVRYRIHSSKAMLEKHYIDYSDEFQELEEKKDPHNSKLKERKVPENGWVAYASKLCQNTLRETGDLPSLSTNTPVKPIFTPITNNDVDNVTKGRTQLVPYQFQVVQKRTVPKVSFETETKAKVKAKLKEPTAKLTPFDPFHPNTDDNESWNAASWPVSSDYSFDFYDTTKATDMSKDTEETANTSGEVVTISSDDKAETYVDSRGIVLEQNASSGSDALNTISKKRTSLLCTNNKPKSPEKNSRPKPLFTADHSSTRSSSSREMPVAPESDHSRITISSKNNKASEKKGKSRRSFISSLSKPKAANKEWLRTSNTLERTSLRKRDQKMKEWLNSGNISGEVVLQETTGGTMETVFYDTKRKNAEDQ